MSEYRFKKFKNFLKRDTVKINLVSHQIESFNLFINRTIKNVFKEISPVKDYTGKELELHFGDYKLEPPRMSEYEAKERNATYEAPLKVKFKLVNKISGEIKEQEVFMGDLPVISERGTFILNGVERTIVFQLTRSPGVFFSLNKNVQLKRFNAKIIPRRGPWLEFETDENYYIGVKVDKKRKMPLTSFLKAFWKIKYDLGDKSASTKYKFATNEDIITYFKKFSKDHQKFIKNSLDKDITDSYEGALIELYKRQRPGELPSYDNAYSYALALFSDEKYDLGYAGRYILERRLHKKAIRDFKELENLGFNLTIKDLVEIIIQLFNLNLDPTASPDDIDSLDNRRIKATDEILEDRLRIGLHRLSRVIKDRMSVLDINTLTPAQLISSKVFIQPIKDFFLTGQLSQFMDQVNILAELEHKRRFSAMGPGGVMRERAGFEVRDVHPSHFSRICPIQTPEGQNSGLVNYMAQYVRINELGFLEAPYFKVKNGVVSKELVWLDYYEEKKYRIAQAQEPTTPDGRFINKKIVVRHSGEIEIARPERVDFIIPNPSQFLSVAASLIPFIEHDEAGRALMGSNMMRQATPLITRQTPLVGTGVEQEVAKNSGLCVYAEDDGRVLVADSTVVKIKYKKLGVRDYRLVTFTKSNQYTLIHQEPCVKEGDKVKKGDLIIESLGTKDGYLALGQNVLVAFLPWEGYNFEDAVIISQRAVIEDMFSSIHIESYEVDVRDTKLGPEETTPDIPNVSDERLKDLDAQGIIRIGAEVREGDILVGKISPKGEIEPTPEERLLRAIFGDKAKDVKDTSLRLPHGKSGRVIGIKVFSAEKGDELQTGVIKKIQVNVAQLRKIEVGDKLANRHGNKGVIAKILPIEDMPFLADGTPVDIILNPLGIASRMNIGQILETHIGMACYKGGFYIICPPFASISEEEIQQQLRQVKFNSDGKTILYDGRTGEPFASPVTVGVMYIMKLIHMVEDKIHMRSIGPYSLITQQPLGGKSQFGGQRFGEMEVWALEAYGASYNLQEMLTIKSDDVYGRAKTYESILKNEDINPPQVPAAFQVLLAELKGLYFNIETLNGASSDEKLKNTASNIPPTRIIKNV